MDAQPEPTNLAIRFAVELVKIFGRPVRAISITHTCGTISTTTTVTFEDKG